MLCTVYKGGSKRGSLVWCLYEAVSDSCGLYKCLEPWTRRTSGRNFPEDEGAIISSSYGWMILICPSSNSRLDSLMAIDDWHMLDTLIETNQHSACRFLLLHVVANRVSIDGWFFFLQLFTNQDSIDSIDINMYRQVWAFQLLGHP